MVIRVEISDGPLAARVDQHPAVGAGATLEFEGVVRPTEDGRAITAIRYETYEPMAQRKLEQIVQEVAGEFGLDRVEVRHSRGVVPVGACSLRVRIDSAHRAEAIEGLSRLIDRLKQDVPIWKHVIDQGGPD